MALFLWRFGVFSMHPPALFIGFIGLVFRPIRRPIFGNFLKTKFIRQRPFKKMSVHFYRTRNHGPDIPPEGHQYKILFNVKTDA